MKDLTKVFTIQRKRFFVVVSIVLICFSVTVCDFPQEIIPDPLSYDEAVKKVIFTDDIAVVDFNNLYHHNIFLVKINGSGFNVPAGNTGGIAQTLSVTNLKEDIVMPHSPEYGFTRYHRAIQEFSANPPSFDRACCASATWPIYPSQP